MAASFPTKTNFANGDVLLAGELNQIGENVNDLNVRVDSQTVETVSGNKTVGPGDAGKLFLMTGTAGTQTFTVPDEAVHGFTPGQRVDVIQMGTAQIQFTAAGPDGFIESKDNNKKSAARYTAFSLVYVGGDDFVLIGDLVA